MNTKPAPSEEIEMFATRTICRKHNFAATVGSNVQFALDYYECPTCVREQDRAYAASQRPCCSRMNIDCCGHDEDNYDSEDQPSFSLTITSANYCDHRVGSDGAQWGYCWSQDCKSKQCAYERNNPPF